MNIITVVECIHTGSFNTTPCTGIRWRCPISDINLFYDKIISRHLSFYHYFEHPLYLYLQVPNLCLSNFFFIRIRYSNKEKIGNTVPYYRVQHIIIILALLVHTCIIQYMSKSNLYGMVATI